MLHLVFYNDFHQLLYLQNIAVKIEITDFAWSFRVKFKRNNSHMMF